MFSGESLFQAGRRAGVLVASSVHVHVTNNGGSWRLGTILIPTRRFDSGEEEKAGGGKVESDNPAHAQTTAKVGMSEKYQGKFLSSC